MSSQILAFFVVLFASIVGGAVAAICGVIIVRPFLKREETEHPAILERRGQVMLGGLPKPSEEALRRGIQATIDLLPITPRERKGRD